MGTNRALQNSGLKNEEDIITYKTQKPFINIAIVNSKSSWRDSGQDRAENPKQQQ